MPRSPQPRRGSHRTEAQRHAFLDRFNNSGLTIREFCRRESLSQSTFQRWRSLAGAPARQSEFIELTPRPAPACSSSQWTVELTLPTGIILRLQG